MVQLRTALMVVVCVTLVAVRAWTCDPVKHAIRFSIEVDLGRDVGQSFGSLFEAQDKSGRIVAGAGFQDVYNTHFRNDRRTLQFFVRPQSGDGKYLIERLPHPDLDCGVYLFDVDGQIYAWTSVRENSVRRWDEASGRWAAEAPAGVAAIRSGDGVMRVSTGRLSFANDTATYDDRTILAPPTEGEYRNYYYAQGRLFFYHRRSGDGAFTHLYACSWTPESSGPIDLSQAIVFDTPYDLETPFAWGQWNDEVLTVSNVGGIYAFGHGHWRTLRPPNNQVSYQVYSMLRWRDRLLLAQYPTGNMFEYRGTEVVQLEDWPPRLPGASPSARECQTLSIYRGDLFAGVWPWAEFWRRDRNAGQWHSLGRAFTHPEVSDRFVHPYEEDAKRLGLVLNHWGQRITSMIPQGDALLLSTSSKGTSEWRDEYTFLSDEQRREYGAVLRLRMPGNLAASIRWRDQPIRLDFVVEAGRLSIRQDGDTLATAELPAEFSADLSDLNVRWGEGVFGPLSGKLLNRDIHPASE